MKRFLSVIITLVMVFTASQGFAASSTPSAWALSEVRAAINEGIVPESLQSNYQSFITRKEFCEMIIPLFEKLGGTAPTSAQSPFADTDSETVAKAAQLGIVLGVGDGLFAPDSLITRQEICTMYARTAVKADSSVTIPQNLPNSFPDVDSIDSWALENVKYINMLEVMIGDEENRINPHNNTTREQAILLSHRMIKAFSGEITDFLAMMGFTTSGNNSTNMMNGAFAITYTGGPLYLSDNTGIYTLSNDGTRSYITSDKAKTIYMQSKEKYFVKESDSLIYDSNLSQLTTMKAEKIVPISEYVYFTRPDAEGIYRVRTSGGNAELFIKGKVSSPVSSGKHIYYTMPDGIYAYDLASGETNKVYNGTANAFSVSNSKFYFKDSENYLCTADTDGSNFKRISKVPVNLYATYGSEGICFTTADGLYKTNPDASFVIKLSSDTFAAINTYNNYIFAKDADDNIYRIKSDYSEFTKLN